MRKAIFLFVTLAVAVVFGSCVAEGTVHQSTISNASPVIKEIKASKTTVEPGESILLSVSATDSDGKIVKYRWSADKGSFSDPDQPQTSWTAPGDVTKATSVTIMVTVTDDDGATASKSIGVTISPSGSVDLNRGLVAYYSFDNCDARDDSGNGNDGTIMGDPQCVDGVHGKAFYFDGVDDYIDLGNINNRNGDFTLVAWVKINDVYEKGEIVAKGDTCQYPGYKISYNTAGKGEFFEGSMVNTNGYYYEIFSSGTPQTDLYYQVVFTLENFGTDQTLLKLYIDGSLDNQAIKSTSGWDITSDARFNIAYSEDSNCPYFFNGIIDEVRIYNRALSAEEVAALYNSYKP